MKMRKFIVYYCRNEHVPCGYSGSDKTIGLAEFVPTVSNVRQAVENFMPGREICEKTETIAEMLEELFDLGIFSVPLVTGDHDVSESLMFNEIG